MSKTIRSLASNAPIYTDLTPASPSGSNRTDADVARVGKQALIEMFTTPILNIREFKCTYPKMSLYQFRGDDTWLTTAGRVALWAVTFFTAGLIAACLLTYDVFQNFKVESDQKQKVCDALDQLMSCVSHTQSKLSDVYKKIGGTSIGVSEIHTSLYKKEIDPNIWKKERVKEYLEHLKHDKDLTHKEICHKAIDFIHHQLREDGVKTYKKLAEELAQRVGMQIDCRMQKYNDKISSIQVAVDCLTNQLKDPIAQQLSKRSSFIEVKLIRAEAALLIKTLEYIDEIRAEVAILIKPKRDRNLKNWRMT